jgi:ankyrin repeat protein
MVIGELAALDIPSADDLTLDAPSRALPSQVAKRPATTPDTNPKDTAKSGDNTKSENAVVAALPDMAAQPGAAALAQHDKADRVAVAAESDAIPMQSRVLRPSSVPPLVANPLSYSTSRSTAQSSATMDSSVGSQSFASIVEAAAGKSESENMSESATQPDLVTAPQGTLPRQVIGEVNKFQDQSADVAPSSTLHAVTEKSERVPSSAVEIEPSAPKADDDVAAAAVVRPKTNAARRGEVSGSENSRARDPLALSISQENPQLVPPPKVALASPKLRGATTGDEPVELRPAPNASSSPDSAVQQERTVETVIANSAAKPIARDAAPRSSADVAGPDAQPLPISRSADDLAALPNQEINKLGADGLTPLISAIVRRETATVQALLAQGADPNFDSREGATALMYAAWNGDAHSIKLLIEEGGDLNRTNLDGKTALMAAAATGNATVVKQLLAGGAQPDLQALRGWTALMYAVWRDHTDVVDILLEHGANAEIRNIQGKTALDLAADRNNWRASRRLRN